jgi:hypothetical protein
MSWVDVVTYYVSALHAPKGGDCTIGHAYIYDRGLGSFKRKITILIT